MIIAGIQPGTLVEREVVLRWLREHPESSIEDVARSGLYVARRAQSPENAAVCWARSHVCALRAAGLVVRTSGTGARGNPLRFSTVDTAGARTAGLHPDDRDALERTKDAIRRRGGLP